MPGPRIALVAGEPSGDWLGGGLIRALRRRYPDAVFEGVTGPDMRAAGCRSLADIEQLSLFGIGEVVREIPRLLRLRRRLARHFLATRPDVFIGIDAPAFNTALEYRLRRQGGLATVHYVCPTLWAWRAGRIHRIRRAVDLLLAIFPFELEYFGRRDVRVRYIGHRLADELPMARDAQEARDALQLPAEKQIAALLPGSRRSEVRILGPAFIATARWLRQRMPDLRFVAPMATPAVRTLFAGQLTSLAPDLAVQLVDGRAREVLAASDVALVASGTATLEALLLKTPMVVAYALSPLNTVAARLFRLHRLVHFSMPNLIAQRALVPELRQGQVRPGVLGPYLHRLLTSPAERDLQIAGFRRIHRQLRCNADVAAAAAVAEIIERRQ